MHFNVSAGIDTGIAIYNRYVLEGTSSVGYAAHFAGALAGKGMGILSVPYLTEFKAENFTFHI